MWRASAPARVGDPFSTVPFPAWQSIEPRLRMDHRICEGRKSARNPACVRSDKEDLRVPRLESDLWEKPVKIVHA